METGMSGCKPIDTPMDPNTKLKPRTDEMAIDKGQYQCLVGKVINLTHTCPIISFAVNIVSKFLSNPLAAHLEAVYRVIRYLKKDRRKRPLFTKSLNYSRRSTQIYVGLGLLLLEDQFQGIVHKYWET